MDNDISALERKCLLRHHIPAIPIPTLRHLLSEDFPETFGHCSKQNYGSEFRLKITFLVIFGDPSLKLPPAGHYYGGHFGGCPLTLVTLLTTETHS